MTAEAARKLSASTVAKPLDNFVPGPIVEMSDVTTTVEMDIERGLNILRAPFPPDQIEKLPKPMWKGAWDNKKGSNCPECHGYHVLDSCIHLDYVGHANATNRLLEADPFWSWEPMAFTEQGLPLFSDGGLWIRLTVCGVTRIGFGDGKSIKEVIGDAIRNAAMRFGVALDLWAKIDLHAERNPGNGKAPSERPRPGESGSGRRPREGREGGAPVAASAPPRAENQDALDALQSVCDEHGYSTQYCIDRFYSDHDQHIRDGSVEDILLLAEALADEATSGPEDEGGDPSGGRGDDGSGDGVADGPTPGGDGGADTGGEGAGGADGVSDAAVPPAEMF